MYSQRGLKGMSKCRGSDIIGPTIKIQDKKNMLRKDIWCNIRSYCTLLLLHFAKRILKPHLKLSNTKCGNRTAFTPSAGTWHTLDTRALFEYSALFWETSFLVLILFLFCLNNNICLRVISEGIGRGVIFLKIPSFR